MGSWATSRSAAHSKHCQTSLTCLPSTESRGATMGSARQDPAPRSSSRNPDTLRTAVAGRRRRLQTKVTWSRASILTTLHLKYIRWSPRLPSDWVPAPPPLLSPLRSRAAAGYLGYIAPGTSHHADTHPDHLTSVWFLNRENMYITRYLQRYTFILLFYIKIRRMADKMCRYSWC